MRLFIVFVALLLSVAGATPAAAQSADGVTVITDGSTYSVGDPKQSRPAAPRGALRQK
jgi:hypothetical protein